MILSEPAKPAPNPGVITWLESQPRLDLAISVLTLGEIARGVGRMQDSKRKRELQDWLTSVLPAQFEGRVLSVDGGVAFAWGELTVQGDNMGRPLPVPDGLLLATARVHGLTLVTRNMRDADGRGVPVFNPYQDEAWQNKPLTATS
jgi:predicted nucleic acid-binding protein